MKRYRVTFEFNVTNPTSDYNLEEVKKDLLVNLSDYLDSTELKTLRVEEIE